MYCKINLFSSINTESEKLSCISNLKFVEVASLLSDGHDWKNIEFDLMKRIMLLCLITILKWHKLNTLLNLNSTVSRSWDTKLTNDFPSFCHPILSLSILSFLTLTDKIETLAFLSPWSKPIWKEQKPGMWELTRNDIGI